MPPMRLSVSVFVLAFVPYISSYNVLSDFHPNNVDDLKTAYYKVLDHNNDGIVTMNELKLGILSIIESDALLDDESIPSYIPHEHTCHPSFNFVDFADCVIIAARHMFKNKSSVLLPSEEVAFDDIFSKYIGQCTDTSPYKNQYCHDIVMYQPELCSTWFKNHKAFCKLSCYACEHEPHLFTDQYPVRGLSGKYRSRVEDLSHYHIPDRFRYTTSVSNCTSVHKNQSSNHSGQILFISDIHIEPWYNVDGSHTVSRFDNASFDNMWQCRNNKSHEVPCSLTGVSDPPINLWESAMQFLKHHASPSDLHKDILIMGGDTQSHDYRIGINGSNSVTSLYKTVPRLLNKVLSDILSVFNADSVFYAAGNNDGEHDIIFCNGSDPKVNSAWAHPLIANKIVTNALKRSYTYHENTFDQITVFNKTGYYIKKIPPIFAKKSDSDAFYAIILNTNLGASNAFQNAVFGDDLKWIKSQPGGHVLVIGHHPDIVSTMVPSKYQSLVRGSFSGHVHHFVPTDPASLFTVLPATTQGSPYAAVMTGGLNKEGNVILDWDNFNQYLGENHTIPEEKCWGYAGQPK